MQRSAAAGSKGSRSLVLSQYFYPPEVPISRPSGILPSCIEASSERSWLGFPCFFLDLRPKISDDAYRGHQKPF
jgi:hypothetical protein